MKKTTHKLILLLSFCILLFTVCNLNSLHAQNLLPNPSFEQYTVCPGGPDALNDAIPWYCPNASSPDYFNSCATSSWFLTPDNWFGFQFPRTGDAYAGFGVFHIIYPNYREYIRCQLSQPLIANMQYCIEFYVSLSDSSKFAVSNIGAYFSVSNIITTGGSVMNIQPQIENPDSNILSNKENWIRISGCFYANGGEEYLTIGNFKNDTIVDTLSTNSFGNYEGQYVSYYYIDDISVIEDTTTGIHDFNKDKFLVYPNPCKKNFIIENQSKNEIVKIILFNSFGNIIKEFSENQNNNSYDVKNLQNGYYFLRIILTNKSTFNYQLIINN